MIKEKIRRRRPRILRLFFIICLLFLFLLLAGFGVFLTNVNNFANNKSTANADGIVVLTGGYARLEPAVQLLREKRGKRLLISGVNRSIGDQLLKDMLDIDDYLFECCIDVDQDAMNTVGNALGTSQWATLKGYETLLVVTNDYHMPRSLIELRREVGGIELLPYAISNNQPGDTSLNVRINRYRVLLIEYGKLLAAMVRGVFPQLGTSALTQTSGAK